MASEAVRLVDELTTLLYEPCLGTCLTHGPDCLIVACGACRRKADKPESVVHDSDCPVYRLIRAEEANAAVIRANAEEIADLEDRRDELEAQVNALTAQMECRNELTARLDALLAERDALRARAERAELANTAGRRYLDAADKMYALRAWDGNGKVMRLWGEWRATLAAASDSISHSGESSRLSE